MIKEEGDIRKKERIRTMSIIKSSSEEKQKSIFLNFKKVLLFAVVLLFGMVFSFQIEVKAEAVVITEINYDTSTITIQPNAKDTEVYFSEGTKKTWEQIPGEIVNGKISMDMSWASSSKNVVLKFKGDSSTDEVSLTLPKYDTKFKATFRKIDGTILFTNAGSREVQWRKKESATWNKVGQVNAGDGVTESTVQNNLARLKKDLETLYTNGCSIVFRLAPVKGTAADAGQRPSREVSVSIPKKSAAPSITVDGSKLGIAVKSGMEYREVGTSTWTECKKTETLLLKDIAPDAMYSSSTVSQDEVKLQFRTKATSSKQISMITTVTVPKQEGNLDFDKEGIQADYTSTSSFTIQVKAASTTTPYEYTIIKKDEQFDYLKASWTSITNATEVTVKKDKAPEGSTVYIRKKSLNKSGDEKFALASKEAALLSNISYPSGAAGESLQALFSIAGVCTEENTEGQLKFTLYSPTKTTVTGISFHNRYNSNSVGTAVCKSTVTENTTSGVTADKKYIITTTITSTKALENTIGEILYADITLANGDKVESTATSGVSLYLYPKTVLNNSVNKEYTAEFDRVNLSKDANDKESFQFRLDFGMDKLANSTDLIAIKQISFGGYLLTAGTDYKIESGTDTKDGKTITFAVITIHSKEFESKIAEKYRDKDVFFEILLNNNEKLNDLISMNLVSTAVLTDAPIAFAFTQGSLKETITVTIPGSGNNNSTTQEEEYNQYTLELDVFDKKYSVGIQDVTWGENGPSVHHNSKTSNGKIEITLSNKKLNQLTTSTPSTINNLIITFDNGFKITSGCKVTVMKKIG